MTYNIKYEPAKDLNHIQNEWRLLQIGEEITMFQLLEWYQMLYAQFSLIRKYKYRIINRLRYSFPYFTPVKHYSESKIMTAYNEEGNLRAFFNYGFDSE